MPGRLQGLHYTMFESPLPHIATSFRIQRLAYPTQPHSSIQTGRSSASIGQTRFWQLYFSFATSPSECVWNLEHSPFLSFTHLVPRWRFPNGTPLPGEVPPRFSYGCTNRLNCRVQCDGNERLKNAKLCMISYHDTGPTIIEIPYRHANCADIFPE